MTITSASCLKIEDFRPPLGSNNEKDRFGGLFYLAKEKPWLFSRRCTSLERIAVYFAHGRREIQFSLHIYYI